MEFAEHFERLWVKDADTASERITRALSVGSQVGPLSVTILFIFGFLKDHLLLFLKLPDRLALMILLQHN